MALYAFSPNLVASGLFTGLFSVATFLHLYFIIKTRAWFMSAFVLGCGLEACGYIARIVSHTYPKSLGAFITQTLCILLAPPLISASLYMTLGRLSQATRSESLLFVRCTIISKIFITFDVISFMLQAAGGGIMSKGDPESTRKGKALVIAGLFIQLVAFGVFTLTTVIFDVKRRKSNYKLLSNNKTLNWFLRTMYAVSALIIIRSIVRTIEYIQGYTGYIIEHEVFIYVFDALLMFIAVALFLVVYPEIWLQRLAAQFSSVDGNVDGTSVSNLVPDHEDDIQYYYQTKE